MTDGLGSCYRHADRETGLACSNCGNLICSDCSVDAVVGQRCLDCHRSIGTTKVRRGVGAGSLGIAVKVLMAVNVLAFVAVWMLGDSALVFDLVQINSEVATGSWWTLVTAAFVHFDLWHIGLNMYALYILGPRIENRLGSAAFVSLYLAAAVGGGLGGFLLGGVRFSQIGASGAVYGLVGWMAWQWWPQRRSAQGRGGWRFLAWMIGAGIVAPALLPFRISWQGHLGGFVLGLVIAAGWDILSIGDRSKRVAFAGTISVALLALVGAVGTGVW